MRTKTTIRLDSLKATGKCGRADSPLGSPARHSRTEIGSHRPYFFVLSTTLLWIVLLSGCAVGPNYHRPKLNVPSEYRGAEGAADQASIADLPWWEVFRDEQLKHLVQTAL